jgi:hypothetical protein
MINPDYTVKLCRNSRCCPTMTIVEQGVVISDDYKGCVTLTHEEMIVLIEEYQQRICDELTK